MSPGDRKLFIETNDEELDDLRAKDRRSPPTHAYYIRRSEKHFRGEGQHEQ